MQTNMKLKLKIRYLLIALTTIIIALVFTVQQLLSERTEHQPFAEGLQGNPWQARSLQEVRQIDRARFFTLYDDSRRYSGHGNDTPIALNKHTKPEEFPELNMKKSQQSKINELKKIILDKMANSEGKTTLGQIKRLFIAANQIRQQRNVSSLDFKSVLQIQKSVMSREPIVRDYGKNFTLSDKEIHTLKYAWPMKKQNAQRNRILRKKGRRLLKFRAPREMNSQAKESGWYAVSTSISRFELYSETDAVTRTLSEMNQLPITYFDMIKRKLPVRPRLQLEGGARTWMTPIKYSRTQETLPNHHSHNDYARHTADIAAFHLDRILGFRRAPPCVGRTINITKDLFGVPSNHRTFKNFTSLIGSVCLEARCSGCHDETTYVCGNPDHIEGAVELDVQAYNLTTWTHPWQQTAVVNDETVLDTDPDFCHLVKSLPPYDKGRRLLDIIDLAIFDFLQGNMDRGEYQTFSQFGDNTFIIHTKNSYGFGRSYHDELPILEPLYQCCHIRFSTFQTLLDFELGPSRLSEVMSTSLLQDPLAPILLKQHLLALDRRLRLTLKMVYECIRKNGSTNVVIMDGF